MQTNFLKNMQYIFANVKKYDKTFIYSVFGYAILTAISDYIWLFLTKIVIEAITNSQMKMLYYLFILVTVQYIIVGVHKILYQQIKWKISYISKKFEHKLVRRKRSVNLEQLESSDYLDIYKSAEMGIQGIEIEILSFINILIHILKIIFSTTIIVNAQPVFMFVVIILSSIYFICLNNTIKKDREVTWNKLSPLWRKLWYCSFLCENFRINKEAKIYNIETIVLEKLKNVNNSAHKLISKSKERWAKFAVFYNLLVLLMEILIYAFFSYAAIIGKITISEFPLYLIAVRTLFYSLNDILYDSASVIDGSIKTDSYRKIIDEKMIEDKAVKYAIEQIFSIEFKQVYFKYKGQNNYILENFNLKILKGEKIALVGNNGSGKSTIAKLMLGLYEPEKGQILINGMDIKDININSFYNLCAPIFQDYDILSFTVLDNIVLGKVVDMHKINNIISQIGFKNKINSLKNGIYSDIDPNLYDNGVKFSGGEIQKIAIARALYRSADLLILDEPTSALDAVVENEIYSLYYSLSEEKICFFISHRLTSTRFCDKILYLEDGKIIESGTHKELYHNIKSKYKEMYDIQAQYYRNVGEV